MRERPQIPLLLPDDLRRDVIDDAGSMRPWMRFGAHEVFEGLADAPDACALASGPSGTIARPEALAPENRAATSTHREP